MRISIQSRTESIKAFSVIGSPGPGSMSPDGSQVDEVLLILGCISDTSRDPTSTTAVWRTSDWEHWKVCTGGVKFNHGPDVPWESIIGIVVYMNTEVSRKGLLIKSKLAITFRPVVSQACETQKEGSGSLTSGRYNTNDFVRRV